MKRIAIIGGGISGLSAAYYLIKLGKTLNQYNKVFLIEASKHFGGSINSFQFEDGVIYETGARSLRVRGLQGLNTLQLAYEIGLSDLVIGVPSSAPAATNRQIFVNNQFCKLPSSFKDIFVTKSPFSKPLLKYIVKDIFTPKLKLINNDISVDDFFRQRFGHEIAMYLADPLCRGINGGDSRSLSIKSSFPLIFNLEREYGSVVLGMIRSSLKSLLNPVKNKSNPLVDKAKKEKWQIWSTKYGLKKLPQTLAQHLIEKENETFQAYLGYSVTHISFKSNETSVLHLSNSNSLKTLGVDHIFSAIPAQNLAQIIPHNKYSTLCSLLNSIKSVSIATVYLEFNGQLVKKDDEKFGFLTPSFSNSFFLGIVYDSCCFPDHNAGKDITRFTVMMGGEWFEHLFGDPDLVKEEDLLKIAIKSLYDCVGVKLSPIRSNVKINKKCIPQYYLGHSLKLKSIQKEINENNLNIDLIGSSYLGIGINDCIYNSKKCVENFLKN